MTHRSYELKMPSNYVLMDKDEMTYLDGGYRLDVDVATAARNIDIFVNIVSLGMAASSTIAKIIAKVGIKWLKDKGTAAMTKIGISTAVANNAFDLILTVSNYTVGNGLAYILDGIDSSRRNGRIQYY